MGFMVRVQSLEKYLTHDGIDVKEVRAVLGVVLNSVINLSIDACVIVSGIHAQDDGAEYCRLRHRDIVEILREPRQAIVHIQD